MKQTKPTIKYKYMTIRDVTNSRLSELGRQGWELVAVAPNEYYRNSNNFYFKRAMQTNDVELPSFRPSHYNLEKLRNVTIDDFLPYDNRSWVRASNCCSNVNIKTVEDLVRWKREDLLKVRNMGKVCVNYIEKCLFDNKLALGMLEPKEQEAPKLDETDNWVENALTDAQAS